MGDLDAVDEDQELEAELLIGRVADALGVATDELTPQMFGQFLADVVGRVEGVPAPLPGFSMRVQDREERRLQMEAAYDLTERPTSFTCRSDDIDEDVPYVRNRWYSQKRGAYITLFTYKGRVRVDIHPRYRSTERIDYWLQTIGASNAWDVDAELEAQEKLRSLLTPHLFNMYQLTGSFLESSPRSGLTYMLRRARPTVALTPLRRWIEDSPLKVLAVLCMHPIAYYERSWAGAMVPTDDVIAHLLYIRGDEHGFWSQANQHHPDLPEAGL